MSETNPTLTALFTDIADAIREKTGDAATIIADDFPDVIRERLQVIPSLPAYLTFSSPNSFTLKVNDATKHWDGTLEYSTNTSTWSTWNGTTTLSSATSGSDNVLYLRGTGNTVITGNNQNYKWVLTGSNIACIGNIENLLDYAAVEAGGHPTMANYCYANMFRGCASLTQAPVLPATTLANYCYIQMFNGCTSLTQAPVLPATTLATECYDSMFFGCTSLTQAPALPATTLAESCYYGMFYGCTSLKLSSTKTDEYAQEYCIPSSGTGTTAMDALIDMFTSTGGTFTGTPEINTTYYLSSDNMIVRETEISTLNGYVGSMIKDKLNKTGDGSNVTAAFTAASSRTNIATGEKLSVLFGKIAKWFSDLGSLAFKSTVAKTDLASDVQTSLGKADSALQSVTKSDVGLGNVDNVKQYSSSNPPPYPVTSVNGQTGDVEVQSGGTESTSQTVTLTTGGWTQSGNRYYQTTSVTGVTASTPVVLVDVALSGTDVNADAAALEAWGIVSANNVAQGNGTLTFYALSVPSVNIPVNVGVC